MNEQRRQLGAAITLALAAGCGGGEPMGELMSPPTRIPSFEGRDLGEGHPLQASIALALPDELREVSGLTVGPDGRLVAVQDEDGALYFIDIEGVRAGELPGPIERVPFGPGGDHEGVAWADGAFFVLRSDGLLLELGSGEGGLTIVSETKRSGPQPDEYEGLCADPGAGRLLVAAKGRIKGKAGRSRERLVFGFDLASRRWLKDPVRVLDRRQISDKDGPAARELPHRTTKKGKRKIDFEMLISGLAQGPDRDELHLLSGPDRTLFVVDAAGELSRAVVFDDDVLPQPEGACVPRGTGPSSSAARPPGAARWFWWSTDLRSADSSAQAPAARARTGTARGPYMPVHGFAGSCRGAERRLDLHGEDDRSRRRGRA